jgi:hypothetical protein
MNVNRVRRLMRLMGLMPIYRRPRTTIPAKGHRLYPYLLRGMRIDRPNQVWCADITYVPLAKGFLYLVAMIVNRHAKLTPYRRAILTPFDGWMAGSIRHSLQHDNEDESAASIRMRMPPGGNAGRA